ncbi:rod shape-determining protein MreC [Alicyclobacillus ferrooxydans]|uniref:Cell shape-determining protein MreC n=1 Tax=Alicyclobacillus ferrooxydans TaxID=471514 RepID=A0A0N8PP36_9BACL|nr:rod shape-determining protein MreC [Alicyclobacillus ferrooxydans]KPV43229.1 rod shape-determining protein MreC [Alicyclobacillus ferrooxydans]
MSRLITNRRLFTLLLSVILLIIIAGITLRAKARTASWPERVIMDVQSTISGWVYRPVSQLTGVLGDIQNLHEMYVENARLKTEMQNYSELRAKLADVQAENSRLNTMLQFKQSANSSWNLVPAHIVGREPAEWGSQLTIDVGLADGIQPNMAVIAGDGSLVGRVAEASSHSAKVVLITDTQVGDGVSALVQNGSSQPPFGVVVGSSTARNQLDLTFLSPIAQISPGQTVVTSGLSNIFPKGIIIGKVVNVTQGVQGLTRSATVAPAANFDYLEDVFVVKVKGQSGQ